MDYRGKILNYVVVLFEDDKHDKKLFKITTHTFGTPEHVIQFLAEVHRSENKRVHRLFGYDMDGKVKHFYLSSENGKTVLKPKKQ